MRLIDADALKANVPETRADIFEDCRRCTTLMDWEVKELVDKQPTVASSPWHRVEEELPEETKVVIIHKEWDDEITLGYSYSFGEIRMWMCLKTPYDIYEVPWVGAGHVDYWMPLPEPPIGTERSET